MGLLRRPAKSIAFTAAGLAVAVAAVIDTPFLTPEEEAAINPPPFSAEQFADEEFPNVVEGITERAVDLSVLAPAVAADEAAAGEQYGTAVGSSKYVFAVRAEGAVTEADADFLRLEVPDLPPEAAVRVPLGSGLSGTPIRDAGQYTFSDFPGQTEYQSVANAFEVEVREQVLDGIDPASLVGRQVEVVGAWSPGGPPNSYVIHPVSLEVAP